jgi:hypothetical protein
VTVRAIALLAVLLAAGPASAALPEGYLVWTKGTADDPASRKIVRLTLPDRSDQRELTTGEDVEPQISPDGRWVAYAKAKFPGGSDYHDFKLWKVYLVSVHGVGEGRREIKIDDDGAWPTWSQSGALFYNQADGTHSHLIRVELDERGQVTRKESFLVTRDLFGGFAEVNEGAIAPDESWVAARTRGNAVQNGVSALTMNPPASVLLARAGAVGCLPRVAPSGLYALIAGATEGIRWGNGPRVPNRREDQLLIPTRSPDHKAYHPGISTDGKWVLAAQGTDADHNAGRYDLSLYPLDSDTMTVGEEQPMATGDFNGWPHLWVGKPGPPPPPRPEVGEFYASTFTATPGQDVVLTWTTFGADQVTLDDAPVAPDGSQTLRPTSTASHVLRAGSGAVSASDTRSITVTVNDVPQPVTIDRFWADPPRVERGRSTILRWQIRNATTIDLDGQRVLPTDSREVSPLETHSYVLTAQGQQVGPAIATVMITVDAQSTGLLPDRGGFRCSFGRGGGAAPAVLLAAALATLLARRRRR